MRSVKFWCTRQSGAPVNKRSNFRGIATWRYEFRNRISNSNRSQVQIPRTMRARRIVGRVLLTLWKIREKRRLDAERRRVAPRTNKGMLVRLFSRKRVSRPIINYLELNRWSSPPLLPPLRRTLAKTPHFLRSHMRKVFYGDVRNCNVAKGVINNARGCIIRQ